MPMRWRGASFRHPLGPVPANVRHPWGPVQDISEHIGTIGAMQLVSRLDNSAGGGWNT